MDSLQVTDDQAKAVQKTPNRISLDSIKAKIQSEDYFHPESIPHMCVCVMLMENGFAVVGKSAPADADNYDEELGRKFSREDAIRQLWPLEAYSLRDRMTA